MNIAIIVAAGTGTRLRSDQPKQFIEIQGKPIIVHTIECFEECPSIDEIILVLSEEGKRKFKTIAERFGFSKIRSIVIGGSSRAESVLNGLNAVENSEANIVAVHDGARPFVTAEEISRVVEEAEESEAACLVAEVTDTIKSVSDGKIIGTIDRAKLRRALTPQAFRIDILRRAFEAADDISVATDECYLVEKLGIPIVFIEGNARNIKITRPDDLVFANAILARSASE